MRKAGFYGIDLYSLWESMEEVRNYLTQADPTDSDLHLPRKYAIALNRSTDFRNTMQFLRRTFHKHVQTK